MGHAELALTITVGVLVLCVFYLAHQLARTNQRLTGWADQCLKHSMAWSDDQRLFMRAELEEKQAEILLREHRDMARGRTRQPTREPENDMADVRVPTGIVTD